MIGPVFCRVGFFSCVAVLFAGVLGAQTVPFTVQSNLFDQANTEALGLTPAPGTETFTVFKPTAATDKFSNGAAMIGFKGHLYCQWQSSPTNEDSPDTWVAYSRSQDGATWVAPMVLAANPGDGYRSSAGWWVHGDTLVAFINHWPTSVSPRGGYTEYITSTNGLNWSPIQRVTMAGGGFLNGIFEQDPHALPSGRIINAAHFQPGLTCSPIYTDDPLGVSGWVRPAFTNLNPGADVSRELEPSWFYRSDGAAVMIFRDQNSTFLKLAAVSTNSGQNWTTAVSTTMPDSRSKQSAGNLPDGTAYIVSNPVNINRRSPLVLARSKNGSHFDKAYLLRRGGSDLQPRLYTGTAKTLGYSYPKSTLWDGYLYSGYTVNKEDVECTRVPLTSLQTIGLGTPTVVQAETGSHGGGVTVNSNNAGFKGPGFVDFPTTGGHLVFSNLNGGTGSQGVLTIRLANGSSSPRTGNLIVNGVTQPITFPVTTGAGSVTFPTPPTPIVPAPASWTNWTTMDVFVNLASGSGNTVRFESSGQDLANIDEIAITPSAVTNIAPVLPAIGDWTINVGVNLNITNNATDTNAGQTLTYSLPVKPTNATINANSGVLSWRPLVTQANTTNSISVVVTDNGVPSLSATQTFSVIVNPLTLPGIDALQVSGGLVGLTVSGQVGPDYVVQGSTNLVDWQTLCITNPATMPFNWSTNVGTLPAQFYRIRVGPPLP
jgi:hypothetical protein